MTEQVSYNGIINDFTYTVKSLAESGFLTTAGRSDSGQNFMSALKAKNGVYTAFDNLTRNFQTTTDRFLRTADPAERVDIYMAQQLLLVIRANAGLALQNEILESAFPDGNDRLQEGVKAFADFTSQSINMNTTNQLPHLMVQLFNDHVRPVILVNPNLRQFKEAEFQFVSVTDRYEILINYQQ